MDSNGASDNIKRAARRGGTGRRARGGRPAVPWGGGVATDPATCFGMFRAWTVPCGGSPTVVAGAVTALVVWLVLELNEHPKLT